MNTTLSRWSAILDNFISHLTELPKMRLYGRLTKITGLIMEAEGIKLPLGTSCFVERKMHGKNDEIMCEVIGFHHSRMLLMPLSDIEGVAPDARIYAQTQGNNNQLGRLLPVGDALLGRILDAQGKPLDNKGILNTKIRVPLNSPPINPLERQPINQILDVGIRAINALITIGRGQRIGLFAGSGVGKSVLLGMIARFTQADIIVVGLIGERGREVKDFIENILGKEGLQRAVVVAAPADVSPLLRMQGASYATRIAEYFRDQNKNVLLIMDSLTRYSMAQREIALAIGEPPATKGYPPSVFAKLPALVERAGNGKNGGSITAFYTVLTEGDDQQDPIADSARAILDGHIVLSRSLAESGHYPAIDIEASISRAMTELIDKQHYYKIQQFKQLTSSYQRNRDIINVGAYSAGSDPVLDIAIQYAPNMVQFLKQGIDETCYYSNAYEQLFNVIPNHEPIMNE
ncbi:flagellar protein export ATPase FliI [Providencia sneebia]|uniref:Flagellum-specific ATP synthase n=1 Tax=Providencia sneebia DSM 19967 TaxID=1141660 RepID=K8WM75_9GAMM|nr:flagellum-specific ATP synthase [Providencia sneebia DSM 19967]